MRLVKFTLFLTVVTILVCLSMLVGIALTYTGDTNLPDDPIGGAGEEITPPAIDIELSMAVIPDADGKVPEGGVSASDDKATVEIPAGVQLEEGAESLTFTATSMDTTADVSKTTRDEVIHSVDLHVAGVAKDNTVPMSFAIKGLFPKGLNNNNVRLFHVENGETIEMTLTTTPVNHNEFSYDPLTGDAVITIASFSEITAYADTNNPWDGVNFDYSWYKADGDLTIANANQFAAFRNIVDGGYYDKSTDQWTWKEVAQDSFEGQKITLIADINLNGHLFDPIGWGYDNASWNRGGVAGKVFKGHFDGGNNTIYGLYQNGWDLDPDKVNYSNYTYTNCGFGLFAAALDATFENLNIDGADIRVECVETGVLVGLAQGNCTFRNINILGCRAANYQRPVGGVVGEVSPKMVDGVAQEGDASKHTFDNVYVDSNTVVGSMWGDFDAPVGGVIGAYWDDAGKTTVEMKNVTVACRLDVYNDVTSTYQWYAYRRAGMLIGNTDRSNPNDAHKAYAGFLTCLKDENGNDTVHVYYGDWADYHYCEFNKANAHWPWVRVEPGEYCEGYSNPRWGRPTDPNTGNPVTDSVHSHGENEGHLESIPFHQLYGGGQGVYGEETHPGVSEGIYTVTYMDHGKILHVDNVTDNSEKYIAPSIHSIIPEAADGTKPAHWVDADGKIFTELPAGRTADIIVYPKWPNEYTVRCLDTYGEVAYYNFVTDTNTDAYGTIADEINNTLAAIQTEIDKDRKVMIIVWEKTDGTTTSSITANDIQNSVNNQKDFIIKAIPKLQSTSITLEPQYDETTGELVAYHVVDVNVSDANLSITIPDYVGKIPVTETQDHFAEDFKNLHSVRIPATIKKIGSESFPGNGGWFGANREVITLYYEGTPEQWAALTKVSGSWDEGLGKGSRVFFLDATGKIVDGYYLELNITISGTREKCTWVEHKHDYNHTNKCSTCNTSGMGEVTNYLGTCTCNSCKGAERPDKEYWIKEETSN